MTDKQIQTEVVRLVNDVEYAALGFHATGGVERCIRAKEELHGYIAQLERIAGDLQTLCDKQALMLGELEAQLESVGAGGVGAMMPKQLAVECDVDWSAAYQHPALRWKPKVCTSQPRTGIVCNECLCIHGQAVKSL